jgi:predicted house-cleaning noncanonical NTP pyrophosphatase (MazG superfamily)
MIIIDGRESSLHINNFTNLEELLISAATDDSLTNRVVTDVLINNEAFSELYPHQAEDIASDELQSVEIRSMPYDEMATNIAEELLKVTDILGTGSRRVAALFRQADDDDALEMLQDLLEVTRTFISMIGVLRNNYSVTTDGEFATRVEQISSLLTEMSDVLENEDWILLADLLEYEFVPACDGWKHIIQHLLTMIDAVKVN